MLPEGGGERVRIAAYCRVSTEKEEQQDSLRHQKEFFEEYAQRYGHTLVRLYADEGISGTSLKKRDDFLRLIEDARAGLFEMVVVKDVSRLARNTVDFLQSIRTLKSCGVNTLFITANMDSLGESEFVLTLFGAMAQEESANLSRRVKFGKKLNAQRGRVPQRIYGYDRIDNFTLEINYSEARVVREIFRLYLEEGLGCRAISLQLNTQGAKTKFDCEWNPRGVRRVLTNSIYCGRYVNNKYEIEDYLTGRQVLLPEEQHYHHERPEWAIVTPEEFDAAQELMNTRRKQYDSGPQHAGTRLSARHLFSTLIKCEHCGQSFYQKHYTYVNTRVYWKCSTNDQFTAVRCENAVTINEPELVEELRRFFASLIPDRERFIEGVLSDFRKFNGPAAKKADVGAVEQRRKKLLAKKERYQEMYANDLITMTELKQRTDIITRELREMDIDSDRPQEAVSGGDIEAYRREVERFLALETVTNRDLRRIIERISVNRSGAVTVVFRELEDSGPAY